MLSKFKFFLLFVLVTLLTGTSTFAEVAPAAELPLAPAVAQRTPAIRPKVALVLEGGGAKGFAHVGVLKVLEERKVPIDMVIGTSMGSIVGAAYATGRSVDELEQLLASTKWEQLFSESAERRMVWYRRKAGRSGELFGDGKIGIRNGELVIPSALVQGQKIEPVLRLLFAKVPPNVDFNELPVPYRAVAADIETGEAVVLDHGNIALAARASMSVPTFFSPVQVDGHLLVDGGITNNLPVDVALAMGADVIIAVECKDHLKTRDKLAGPLAISEQILDMLLERTTQSALKLLRQQDVHIEMELGEYSSTSFGAASEIMALGERQARDLAATGVFDRLAVSAEEYSNFSLRRTTGGEYQPQIDFIEVNGVDGDQAARITKRFSPVIGEPLSRTDVSERIQRLHATGEFSKIGYQVVERDGKAGIVVTAEPKLWLRNYGRIGFSLDDNLDGQNNYSLAFDLRLNELNAAGAYTDLQLESGRSPRIYAEWYQPFGYRSPLFVAPEFELSREQLLIRADGELIAEFKRDELALALRSGYSFGELGEISAGWKWGRGEVDRTIGVPSITGTEFDIGEAFVFLDIDQYDHPDFPTEGYQFSARSNISRRDLGDDGNFEVTTLKGGVPITLGVTTLFLSAELARASDNLPGERYATLGGPFDISGYNRGALLFSNYAIYRAMLTRRVVQGGSSLFPLGGYVGMTAEFASLRSGVDGLVDQPTLFAGSLFVGADTPLLPVYLGVGASDEGERALFLNLGRIRGPRR